MAAVQSNLENLIYRSRTQPHPRRYSDAVDSTRPNGDPTSPELAAHPAHHHPSQHPHSALDEESGTTSTSVPASRRQSAYNAAEFARIGTIREASYDDGAAIMFDADEDERDERSTLLPTTRRESRRRSYGAMSEPVGQRIERAGRKSTTERAAGTSRSRSKARTPPRRDPVPQFTTLDTASSLSHEGHEEDDDRGRTVDERPLSPVSTKQSLQGRYRRGSAFNGVEGESSDEDDVTRGITATGGGAAFGARSGMGMTTAGVGMDVDPAEELCAEDLELPMTGDGLEARQWSEALRVGCRSF